MTVAADWAALPFGIFRDPNLSRRGRWIALSALVGLVAGIGAILFDLVFRLAGRYLLEGIGTFRPPGTGGEGDPVGFGPEHAWLPLVSLLVGGLASGALVFLVAPEAEGHGTDAVIRAFHHLRGRIRRRVPIVKALASAITIGSGGSGGREGPIAQIGAGFGSALADMLKLTDSDRRILMMAGTAGGIGSIFRAPLGASLFAAEVLYGEPEFEYKVLLPGLISAITGYSIYSLYAGWGLLFHVPPLTFHHPAQLALYVVLGLLCGLVGFVYPRIFYGMRDKVFRPMPLPRWLKPAVGAGLLGLIAVVFPQSLGMGYGYIQEAIDGRATIGFLLLFMAVKIVATSLTISSGGSGGVFGPSLVIGGALGGAFGLAAAQWFPAVAPHPAACIMVGMGGFFAGVAKVPFASVIMVMEMTGSYGLLVPSLAVATVAYLFLPIKSTLFENQIPARADSPAHQGSFARNFLVRNRIRDCWQPRPVDVVTEQTSLTKLAALLSGPGPLVLPVADVGGRLAGELSLDDIRDALVSGAPRDLVVAWDLMRPVTGPLTPEDDLARAAGLMADREAVALIVVAADQPNQVLGIFSQGDLVAAYARHAGDEPESAL